jgi:ankyrin repeat protein
LQALGKPGTYRDTPLILAARHGYPQLVEPLLEAGADIDARNKDYNTPLHEAAGHGHLDIVRLLIKRGADLNGKIEVGVRPGCIPAACTDLRHARRSGRLACMPPFSTQ